MLSQYTWGQFILFVLVLVVLYYLGVGWFYYRDELQALLTPGEKGAAQQLAGAGVGASSAPPLVRPTSAFGKPAPEATDSEEAPTPEGAAQNLPTNTEAVVTGELPDSTAAATGLDDSTAESGPMNSAAVLAAGYEEQFDEEQFDENRTEENQADEQLASLVRQAAHQMPAEEEGVTVAHQPAPTALIEPLATFEELIASPQDVMPALEAPLCEAGSLAEYIAQVMGGAEELTAVPAALTGTDLEAQLLARTHEHAHELTLLFGDD